MEAKHRYRLLIYFAALILCLSVCFANAEEVTSPAETSTLPNSPATMIFESSNHHAAFLPALQQSFVVPAAEAMTEQHVVPQSVLQQVTESNRPHRFWHSSAKRHTSLVLNHQVGAASGVANDARNNNSVGESE